MLKSIGSFFVIIILISYLVPGCNTPEKENKTASLFSLLSPERTHIDFANTLTEGLNTNVLMYEYFYNGGGVGVGDVNGDGLEDIYFTGNMVSNKLYLNKGKMEFADITDAANVAGRPGPWKTGVTMVDINGDNKLDIYVCYSGKLSGAKRANQLFVNDGNAANGTPHFSEQAEAYGIADTAYSTQAYFFDVDKDGDLDMFLLNHNPNSLPVLDEASTASLLQKTNPAVGVRLYRNDKNHFVDITDKSGFSSSSLTYGLGAGIADINNDGWQDIYISNDYTIPDYLYINNHDGTFSNHLQSSMGHITQFSMGNSVSDVNNDGLPDIFTLDMLPEDNHRQKLLFAPDNYEKFALTVTTGFYYQYMRNMLQLNNGDGSFSEVGQLAGISNTDWSWAPLFADYDNDGWKDLFVTNGYTRDYTNMDFLKYYGDFMKTKGHFKREDVLELVRTIPSSDVPKYIYRNNGNLTFTNKTDEWGFTKRSNGNGAAYADLDNDGDLDLIENNINQPAFIYENQSDKQQHHYLQIKLSGEGLNSQGIGAKVILYTKQGPQFLEQMPSSGYESTVSSVLHFGTGSNDHADSVRVKWLSGKQQVLTNVKADQLIELKETDAKTMQEMATAAQPLFKEVKSPIGYQHIQGAYYDFKKQPLLINPLSFSGPCMVKGDVNKDGLEDVFVGGGGLDKPGALYLQRKGGEFIQKAVPVFENDKRSQDADALFFDANGDGYIDLYVASGGYYTYKAGDSLLQDRLYLNDGKENFTKATAALPSMLVSKSCARVADINHDSYPDLFIGGRVNPGRYPETPQSYLLINDGKGHFTDRTAEMAPALQKIGMVTDAVWVDLNGDKADDLVLTGEWMPVSVFINQNGKLEDRTSQYFDKTYSGWWNTLLVHDFNGDGKVDIVAGNQGLNTQCKVSDKEPAEMFFKDFDDNGAVDPFLCFYIKGKSYPYVTRDELLDQISSMRTRFADYKSYADITIHDLFTDDDLKTAGHLQANELATCYFEMGTDGKYHVKQLPPQVQFSPVFSMLAFDYDKDGKDDLLLGGNIHNARIRFGNYDANYGVLLKGDGKGSFQYINQDKSGFHIIGDIRSMQLINNKILFGINGGQIKAFEHN